MNNKHRVIVLSGLALAVLGVLGLTGTASKPGRAEKPKLAVSIKPQHVTDSLRALIAADREVYTQVIVQRLQDEARAFKVSPEWEQEKACPTPCQMLRLNSEAAGARGVEFSYTLRALKPINPRNAPETEIEKKGLEFVTGRPDLSYSSDELLGGRWYFTAVYPDVAVSQACVSCHNQLKNSPRKDYRLGDVMGALVIRIALEL
jgi:hypothetical protein